MSLQNDKILIVIPVFNHGSTLREVTQKAIETGLSVLVVDDGSEDDVGQIVDGVNCSIVRLNTNQGKGSAIVAGVKFAATHGFDAIITIDADGQHDPAEAVVLVAEAKKHNWPLIVIGARKMVQDTVPGSSHFGRRFSNFWVRLECGAELEDTQSGFRLYPVKELLQLSLTRMRYDFEVEVIVKAVWAGLTITSTPISVHYPPPGERISHFDIIIDNMRLSKLHFTLLFRRLLPIPFKKIVARPETEETQVLVKNPLKALKNLCKEHTSPSWLAVAVWMGIFLGALPLIACHTIIIIYVAYRLHLNKVAAVAASQFCMPPVVPVLCIEVGYFLQHGSFILDVSWQHWLLEIHYRLFDWFVGSLVVGPILGLAGAAIVLQAAKRMQRQSIDIS